MRWPDSESLFPSAPRDDGSRPSFIANLLKKVSGPRSAPSTLPATLPKRDEEEWPVVAAPERGKYVSFDLRAPADFRSRPENTLHLLRALGTSERPVAFEILFQDGSIHFQVATSEADAPHVFANLEGFFPEIALIPAPDRLEVSWWGVGKSFIVDFALSEEFFIPLSPISSFAIDPYIALVSALSQAEEDGAACFQILFEKTRNPWRRAVLDAVGGIDGSGIFTDAPHFLRLADEKTRHPLYAAVIRIGAKAQSTHLAKRLASRVEGYVSQFAASNGNSLIPLSNEGYPVDMHEEAFLTRQTHRAGMLLSLEELCGFVHVPDASVRQPFVVREAARSKPPPKDCASGSLFLGENEYRGQKSSVFLTTEERLAHLHVVGASGTGKSTFLCHCALADIEAGRGTIVIDPHGDLIDDLLARIPAARHRDVIVFDPSDDAPVGLNPLFATSDDEREHLASDVVGIFERLATSWGDSMGSVLSNAVLALVESEQGGTLLDLRRFLLDDGFRKSVLATVSDEEVRFFWEQGYRHIGGRSIGPILTRLDAFIRSKTVRRVIDVTESTFDWEEVLSGRHIFLAKLSFGILGEANASLLGSLIVSQLHLAALRRQKLVKSERKSAFIYVDEFQHFTTPSLAALLSEGRKYGVGLVLAHQTLSQLGSGPVESAVLGNTYTRMAFRVGEHDAGKLSAGYSFFEPSDFLSLGRGEALVRMGTAERVCNVTTSAPLPLDPRLCATRISDIRQASREQFGQKNHPMSEGIVGVEAAIDNEAAEAIAGDPRTDPPPGTGNHDFLPVIVPRSRLWGEEHRRLAEIIARLGQERGFIATLEKPVAGGRVDVALERAGLAIGCEVSVSTEVAHELGNAAKCLRHGFQHVILITSDESKRARLKAAAKVPEFSGVEVLSLEGLAIFLDTLLPPDPPPSPLVRGYKVKINRKQQSPGDVASVRDKIGRALSKPSNSD